MGEPDVAFTILEDPTHEVVRQPVNLSASPQPDDFRLPAPDLGEHNEEILREIGLDDAEIEALVSAGAI